MPYLRRHAKEMIGLILIFVNWASWGNTSAHSSSANITAPSLALTRAPSRVKDDQAFLQPPADRIRWSPGDGMGRSNASAGPRLMPTHLSLAGGTLEALFPGEPRRPPDSGNKLIISGYGPHSFVATQQPLSYTISFENVHTATAATKRIQVVNQLDMNLDPHTFRLKEIGFGKYRVAVPEDQAFFQGRIQLGEDLDNLLAEISAGVDIATGQVTLTLTAIDPRTGEQPQSALLGLLPPNDATGRGLGHLTYTVRPKADVLTGAQITNNATIIFDTEEAIITNTIVNTIDADAPTSAVAALLVSSPQTFTLSWSGDDVAGGSGLQSYDIWVSENDGPYRPFISGSRETGASFAGVAGRTYRFYSIARDNAGNLEAAPQSSDALTTVPQSSGCTLPLSPTSRSFAANGGTGSFNVTTLDPGCTWTATTSSSFITITQGGSGIGNGAVSFSVAPNPTTNIRNGTITIEDRTFTVYQGVQFNDVPGDYLFYTEIGILSARGVTLGCGVNAEGQPIFCPEDTVTREQMAAFIIRALGEFNPPTPATQRFNDVPPSNIFYNFIDRMAALQITLGCGGGNYCPLNPVLREQMAAFIIRALGEPNPPTPQTQRFADVPPNNSFYNFIDRMAVLNITSGCGTNGQGQPLFCPGDNVTRGQMAKFLVRAFNL